MKRLQLFFLFCAACALQSRSSLGDEDKPFRATPLQIGLTDKYQLAPETWAVWGLRLGLPIASNDSANGLDIGLSHWAKKTWLLAEFGMANHVDEGQALQIGLYNRLASSGSNESTGNGAQLGLVNKIAGVGLQLGLLDRNTSSEGAGVQIGISDVADNYVGVQFGGLLDVSDTMTGVQACGGLTFCTNQFAGVQIGGIFSVNDEGTGLQMSGVASVSGEQRGIQYSLLFNLADEVHGLQCCLLDNKVHAITGVQVGLVNSAKRMTGVQIGLLNIIETSSCKTLPLVNAHF